MHQFKECFRYFFHSYVQTTWLLEFVDRKNFTAKPCHLEIGKPYFLSFSCFRPPQWGEKLESSFWCTMKPHAYFLMLDDSFDSHHDIVNRSRSIADVPPGRGLHVDQTVCSVHRLVTCGHGENVTGLRMLTMPLGTMR